MIRRLFKFFIILPLLASVWAYANSIGVTATLSQATGIDIPDAVTIPGIDRIFEARNGADEFANEAKRQARLRAIKEVRQEVRKRFGPDVAALVPADLTLDEAQRVAKALAAGRSLSEITDLLKGFGPQPSDGPKPDPTPGNNGGPSLAVNGGPKMFNTARAQLADLAVKGRAPMTGYSRDEFGSEWSDSVGNFSWTDNGCDSRNDALKRDLVKIRFESGSTCEVASGVFTYERYTGQKNRVFDANDDAYETDADIDHIVALGNAWVTGGQYWDEDKRAEIANDPLNLWSVDPSSNRAKGDSDAATWLPSNKAFRCAYVSRQVQVKTKYGLWVTSAEKAAIARVLDGCPS